MDYGNFQPAYLALYEKGTLQDRIEEARERLKSCRICPRECGINRQENEKGYCRTGLLPVVSTYSPHFGEEDP